MTTVNRAYRCRMMRRTAQRQNRSPSGLFCVGGGWAFRGAKKGGGGASAPIEFPDSLRSTSFARVLLLQSEGEVKGPVNGLRSIYLNDTPIQNADGSLNFLRVSADFRAGTQWQDPIPGFPGSESTTNIGIELQYGTPWIQTISNTQLSVVRVTLSVGGLQWVDQTTGNIWGWYVGYAIDVATDGGAFVEVVNGAFNGKTTSNYSRTIPIDLPAATSGWQIRVRRLTPNQNSSTISDTTFVTAITEVIYARLRYPMSALLAITCDAEQFSSVPTISSDSEGRIIAVPSNYNPDTRQYIGTWDGTFKQAYTNNPAWVFYDMVINDRYGCGDLIDPAYVDKWNLYVIGQYCDEMIPNGKGGTEPRFTCNCYIQSRADAYRLLSDLASVFRGTTYWGAGSAVAVADMPKDPVYTYTAANVINGEFSYAGSPRSTRYTVALVSWNDPDDMYRQKIEVIEYTEGVARYGIQQTELTAFGCTSQSQAQRLGKWVTRTSFLETQTVTFSIGLDGVFAAPGQIIRVADPARAGRRLGGRIRSATATQVELDASIEIKPGDTITVILPSGIAETRTVVTATSSSLTADTTAYTADTTELTADMTGLPEEVPMSTVAPAFSGIRESEAVWARESEELSAQLFRVV